MEDRECEGSVIYDGDDDCDEIKFGDDSDDEYDNWTAHDSENEESDGELEDSTLYNVCEILFIKEKFGDLQTRSPDQMNYMINLLDQQEKDKMMQMFA